MSSRGASALDAYPAERQVELVVNNPDVVGRHVNVPQRLGHRFAREIHERLRHHQPDAARLRATHEGLPALAVDTCIQSLCELAHARKAEIVARVGILPLRVAQADDQPLAARLFFNWVLSTCFLLHQKSK